ncbi:major facilitator superfamily domain-containing protein [Desarmillaria tabescens]|uniref:Major facilitator superfamily domain-containing protein n=1 Tax=Armillaria tabescens TaxID=1929756 RepID=A0AA39KDI7_ARMTA|nr:major facilitator superfamily domain-containing protein [Desarmillaria tabescens]KAK0457809.1 major facilitator superfamily domain-containing protein [Desarmillaria tabescens]
MADLHLHPTLSRPIGQHLQHTDSLISSETHVWQPTDVALEDAHEKPTLPLDTKEQPIENLEDDWEHDPVNARNWPSSKKWTAVCIVSFYTLIPPLASSMMAPGLPEIAATYGVTDTVTTALILSVFLVSFAVGPLFLAPMSEMYGRTWVLHIGNIFSLIFNLGCAFAPNTGALIAFRFLSGFAGSAPIACGGGSVSDLFSEKDRASAMSLYTLGPLMGPAVGPIAGGFIAQTVGVKYVFITIAGASGLAGLVGLPLLRETYAPVIRLRRAKMSPDSERMSQIQAPVMQISKWRYLWLNLSRPIILLTRSLICFVLSLYMAFMYGIYYLMFATFASFFKEAYGFGPGIGGLVYLGLGGGFILATLFGARFADQVYHYLAEKNGGQGTPEMRIPALFFGSLFVPIGLLWYGWSAQEHTHWIMPIIGSGIYGFGMMTTYLPIQLYLVDSFSYAASALAAAAVFRSLFGFAFPLFANQMFDALGLGGGNTLLAGLAVVLGIPFPIWIYYRGEQMRMRSSFSKW